MRLCQIKFYSIQPIFLVFFYPPQFIKAPLIIPSCTISFDRIDNPTYLRLVARHLHTWFHCSDSFSNAVYNPSGFMSHNHWKLRHYCSLLSMVICLTDSHCQHLGSKIRTFTNQQRGCFTVGKTFISFLKRL